MGFAIGPALGGVLAQSFGLHLPFVACAAGLVAASGLTPTLTPTLALTLTLTPTLT